MCKKTIPLVICVMILAMTDTWADVSLPTLFSDHAVLQREMAVPVWGTGAEGEYVTVSFNGQQVAATTVNGTWQVTLAPMALNTSPGDMVITGDNNSVTITGMQVGEVWVCSGQSNMVWQLQECDNAAEAIADSGNYNIRLFQEPLRTGPEGIVWEVCGPDTSPDFSAVAFFFARRLSQTVDIPIGLIQAATSATSIEMWSTDVGGGTLYKEQIQPLMPYAIRGVLWYQGEWDARVIDDSEAYYQQLPALINQWRIDWQQGSFPFYIVQLPRGWEFGHIIRDAQLNTALTIQDTALAVLIDQPESSPHPIIKEPVGIRLALAALALIHEQPIVYSSPVANESLSYIDGSNIVVVFDHVGTGLRTSGGDLNEFEIAGDDQVYYSADAAIIATDAVAVSSPSVSDPVSVRYAYASVPEIPRLFNSADLPASPFRIITPPSTTTTEIFVQDISMGYRQQGKNYYAQATVWIKDNTGADVEGATVYGQWSDQVTGPAEGITTENGTVLIESPGDKEGGIFTFTITDIVKQDCIYNPSLNVETSDSVTVP